MKDDRVYLAQILDSTEKIREFVNGMDNADFLKDRKTQSAVIMQFALIGELAKRISVPVKSMIDVHGRKLRGSAIERFTIIFKSICRSHGTQST